MITLTVLFVLVLKFNVTSSNIQIYSVLPLLKNCKWRTSLDYLWFEDAYFIIMLHLINITTLSVEDESYHLNMFYKYACIRFPILFLKPTHFKSIFGSSHMYPYMEIIYNRLF